MSEKEENNLTFQERLKELAKRVGGVKALAVKSGVPYGTMQKYVLKKGAKDPGRKALIKILSATNADPQWLLTGKALNKDKGIPDSTIRAEYEKLLIFAEKVSKLPKFSEKAYLDVLNRAESFTTRDLMLKTTSSPIYRSEYDYAPKSAMMRIFGTPDPENIVTYDFHDSRIPNGPVQLYVNVAQLKPRQNQRVLVIQDGRPYLMKGEISGTPPNTTLVDVAEIAPIPSVSYEQLVREDAIVGTIEGYIGKG